MDCTDPLDCIDCTEPLDWIEWLELSDTPPAPDEDLRNLPKREDELFVLLVITFPPGGRIASICSGVRNNSYCLFKQYTKEKMMNIHKTFQISFTIDSTIFNEDKVTVSHHKLPCRSSFKNIKRQIGVTYIGVNIGTAPSSCNSCKIAF